jgi:hypothetical protein
MGALDVNVSIGVMRVCTNLCFQLSVRSAHAMAGDRCCGSSKAFTVPAVVAHAVAFVTFKIGHRIVKSNGCGCDSEFEEVRQGIRNTIFVLCVHKSVTRVLQECKSVTRVLQEFNKSVTRVLQELFISVTRV